MTCLPAMTLESTALDTLPAGTGHRVAALRLLTRRPTAMRQPAAPSLLAVSDAVPEHGALARAAIARLDTLIDRLPNPDDAESLTDCEYTAARSASCSSSCPTCGLVPDLVGAMTPWLTCGTEDARTVISHVARRLHRYAVQASPCAPITARLIKALHETQMTELRNAAEKRTSPHSVRRIILNLVQTRFYSPHTGLEGDEARAHRDSLGNVALVAQLLLHDLLPENAVMDTLKELLCPRNRPDTLPHRIELACWLLTLAGERLEEAVDMASYYSCLKRLSKESEVRRSLKQLVGDVIAQRAEALAARDAVGNPAE
jgi:hypothetical protein